MKNPLIFCLFLGLIIQIHTEISLKNLKVFFESTYDQNKDGFATI